MSESEKNSGVKDIIRRDAAGNTLHTKHNTLFFSFLSLLKSTLFFLLLLFTAVVVAVLIFFDTLLYFAITAAGNKIIGVPVSLEEVETSFSRGDIKLIKLKIGDTNGSSNPILQVDSIYLDFDLLTLLSGKAVIKNLELRNTTLSGTISENGELDIAGLFDKNNWPSLSGKRNYGSIAINRFSIDNVRIIFRDRRKKHSIDGFGIFLKQLTGDRSNNISLRQLKVISPAEYEKNMLEILSANIEFQPFSPSGATPAVKSVEINEMHAVAGVRKNKGSNIQQVLNTFNPFFSSAEDTAGFPALPVIQDLFIRNSSFTIRDADHNGSLHGFGIRFKELHSSPGNGVVDLTGLQIVNPRGQNKNLLNIRQTSISFVPETLLSGELIINNVYADGLHAAAGLRKNHTSDVHELIDSMEDVFFPANDTLFFSPDTAGENDNDDIFPIEINNFELHNGSLIVSDTRNPEKRSEFGAKFAQLSGSWSTGNVSLKNFSVANLHTDKERMLKIKSIDLKFIPESLESPETVFENIDISGTRAVVKLHDDNHADINNAGKSLQILLSPLFPGSTGTASDNTPASMKINRFCTSDCIISLRDMRKNGNTDGLSLALGSLEFTRQPGKLQITNLKISNPRTFSKPEMLNLAYMTALFPSPQKGKSISEIDLLEIDGLHITAEFRQDGKNNIHDSCDSLCLLLSGGDFKCSPSEPQNNTPQTSGQSAPARIKKFNLDNSSFEIWDARQKVPLTMPLKQNAENIEFEGDDQDTLSALHAVAVDMEKQCDGAADVSKLFLNILNSTAQSGIQLLKNSGIGSGKILQNIFSTFQ